MVNTLKHIEFFNPNKVNNKEVHIIGVGAVGSFIALTLAKLGLQKLTIWDFDTVEETNVANQVYTQKDVGKLKTEALKQHLLDNNSDMEVICKDRYTSQNLKGIIFLTVDSINLRYKILTNLQYNPFIEFVVDGRIGLEKGQVISTVWSLTNLVKNHIALSDFDDSQSDAPVSACGTTLSVMPSVQCTSQFAVAQLINFINNKPIKQLVQFDAFDFKIYAR